MTKRSKKRFIALYLILTLLFSLMPQEFQINTKHALAATSASDYILAGECGINLTYTLDQNGVLTITGIGNNAFQYCTGIESITIPDSITNIGTNAFYHCTSLKSITIPQSVIGIGAYAFDGTKIDISTIAFLQGSCGKHLFWKLLGNSTLQIEGTGDITDFSSTSAP